MTQGCVECKVIPYDPDKPSTGSECDQVCPTEFVVNVSDSQLTIEENEELCVIDDAENCVIRFVFG